MPYRCDIYALYIPFICETDHIYSGNFCSVLCRWSIHIFIYIYIYIYIYKYIGGVIGLKRKNYIERSPLKPLDTIVLWCSRGFSGGSLIGQTQ